MLRRERTPVPEEVAELMARWTAKAAKADKAAARGGAALKPGGRGGVRGGQAARKEDEDEADDEQEARTANREKQVRMQQAKMGKERVQQMPSRQGRGGKRR
jgi:nicotinamide mononucleotide (NMN) deamidase PncC